MTPYAAHLSVSAGPHILTVWSSDTDTSMDGTVGFQVTQLTVRLWPERIATGCSRLRFHT